jgi:hypothetical protein
MPLPWFQQPQTLFARQSSTVDSLLSLPEGAELLADCGTCFDYSLLPFFAARQTLSKLSSTKLPFFGDSVDLSSGRHALPSDEGYLVPQQISWDLELFLFRFNGDEPL